MKGGGCSGLSYTFAWEQQARLGDEVFEGPDGAKIFVDKKSLLFLNGTVLDYDTNLISQGVRVQQPEREDDLRLRQLVRRLGMHAKSKSKDRRFATSCFELQTFTHASDFPCPPPPTLQVCRDCGGGAPVDAHFCPQCTKILSLGRHGDYFAFLGLPRKLNLDAAELEQRFRDAEPPVSSRLLLQRDAGRAARQPRAVVVSERRVSHAAAADRADRVPAAARRAGGAAEPAEATRSRCRRRCSKKCSR